MIINHEQVANGKGCGWDLFLKWCPRICM